MIIHIREPFYRAGYHYTWPGELGSIGLGINIKHFDGQGEIFVKVGDKRDIYKLDKREARKFVKKHRSYFNCDGTPLWIIPFKLFENTKHEYTTTTRHNA